MMIFHGCIGFDKKMMDDCFYIRQLWLNLKTWNLKQSFWKPV